MLYLAGVILHACYGLFCLFMLTEATTRRDAPVVSKYIDFPSVRASLRDDAGGAFLINILTNLFSEQEIRASLSMPSSQLAQKSEISAFYAKVVDTWVTPDGLAKFSTRALAKQGPQGPSAGTVFIATLPNLSPVSLVEFRLNLEGTPAATFRLVEGRWKMVAVSAKALAKGM